MEGNGREGEKEGKGGGGRTDSLVIFRCHHYGNSLIHHDLVGTVTMQVYTGQEGRLRGVSLETERWR